MKEIRFKLVLSTTKVAIGYEMLTPYGWQNKVLDFGWREGTFDHRELGDGFLGTVERRLFTGDHLKNGNPVFVGDEISPGNFVEFSFGCFNVNGDRPLSGFKILFL